MVEEEPAQQLGFLEHIVGGLTAITRALVMVAIIPHLRLSCGYSVLYRTAPNPWGHHQYGGRVGSHGRPHREVADRLQQRLRRCAGGQWRVRTLFGRRHHPRMPGQTGTVQDVGCDVKNLVWGRKLIVIAQGVLPVSYTHLTLPTTPYV